jgi:hypothetical protein
MPLILEPLILQLNPFSNPKKREEDVPRAGIFRQSMGARNRVGIGLSYRSPRLHRLADKLLRLAEFIPWNRFLGSINV